MDSFISIGTGKQKGMCSGIIWIAITLKFMQSESNISPTLHSIVYSLNTKSVNISKVERKSAYPVHGLQLSFAFFCSVNSLTLNVVNSKSIHRSVLNKFAVCIREFNLLRMEQASDYKRSSRLRQSTTLRQFAYNSHFK